MAQRIPHNRQCMLRYTESQLRVRDRHQVAFLLLSLTARNRKGVGHKKLQLWKP